MYQISSLLFHTQSKDGKILLAYGFPKETFTPIILLYKDMKAMVHLTGDNTDYFDILSLES